MQCLNTIYRLFAFAYMHRKTLHIGLHEYTHIFFIEYISLGMTKLYLQTIQPKHTWLNINQSLEFMYLLVYACTVSMSCIYMHIKYLENKQAMCMCPHAKLQTKTTTTRTHQLSDLTLAMSPFLQLENRSTASICAAVKLL